MIITIAALLCLSEAFRGIREALLFSPSCLSRLGSWWDASTSWRNKYKDGDFTKGPAFPGSTTVFVFATDALHAAQFLQNIFLCLGIFIALGMTWTALAVVLLRYLPFEFTFRMVRK